MKKFHLTILGSNAAGPANGRISSCHVLNYSDKLFIIDCGEASQIRMQEYKVKLSKIRLICISHLHGDHIFGLPGLVSSLSHHQRTEELIIIGPIGIQDFVRSNLKMASVRMSYDLKFIELNHSSGIKPVLNNAELQISAFPLKHRIQTFGYKFEENTPIYNINKAAIQKYQLTIDEIKKAKTGLDIQRGQLVISNNQLIFAKAKPRSYAYCSDTIYDPSIVDYIQDVDYLYHETTYLDELSNQANERMHTTALGAAKIASLANAGCLITGHYSSRYRNLQVFAEEAKKVFQPVIVGCDGSMIHLDPLLKKH